MNEDDATEKELEKRAKLVIVKAIENDAHPMVDPHLHAFDLIECLAIHIAEFADKLIEERDTLLKSIKNTISDDSDDYPDSSACRMWEDIKTRISQTIGK